MPAKSRSQQRFFGMVHSVQKGDLSPSKVGPAVRKAARNTEYSDAKDFASTKHKNLPEKKGSVQMKYFEKLAFEATFKGQKYSIPNNKESMKIMSNAGLSKDEAFRQLQSKGLVKEAAYFGGTQLTSKEFEEYFGTPFSEEMTKSVNKLIDEESIKYQTPELKGWFKGIRRRFADQEASSEAQRAVVAKILDRYPMLRSSYETKRIYDAIGSLETRIGSLEIGK